MYKLTHNSNTVTRLADNAFIPADNGNRDYREYQEWLAAGNTPQAADIPPLAPVTPTADLLAIIENLRERIALLESAE
jgi:hypothetical protein